MFLLLVSPKCSSKNTCISSAVWRKQQQYLSCWYWTLL